MLRSVLLPLDGSALAEQAVPVAVAVAKRHGALLHLVTSNEHHWWSLAAELPAPVTMSAGGAWTERARAWLEDHAARATVQSGVRTRISALDGRPAAAIDRYAREQDVDLIVLTRHGRGGNAGAWIGSTADALIRLTGVPLLFVHGPVAAAGFRQVVVALDGSTTAERALDTVPWVAPGAHWLLLHVVGPPHAEVSPEVTDVLERERAGHRYLDAVARRAAAAGAHIETRVVISPDVAGTILRDAAAAGADLIVLGTHARPPIVRAILGGVADKIIRRSETAVLIAPPKRDRLEAMRVGQEV